MKRGERGAFLFFEIHSHFSAIIEVMTYNTKQRDAIAELISAKTTDFTVKEICQELDGRGISRATIYRAIEKLESDGSLRKNVGSDGSICYQYMDDCDKRGHCYLKCENCGAIEHVDCAILSGLIYHIKNEHNFITDKHQIILNGSCRKCHQEDICDN